MISPYLMPGIAALTAALATMIGAFGAHGLKKILQPDALIIYETAVKYHWYHALALLFTSWIALRNPQIQSLNTINLLFLAGILVFSGSLYALSISGIKILGIITPVGGTLWIIAWLWLAKILFTHAKTLI
jgi:uncharacterized membrane protein YgdD (TMEM256/DUF423 family)